MIKRNKQIVAAANTILPEECVCCKDMYNIEDRTFKRKIVNVIILSCIMLFHLVQINQVIY